MRAKSCFEWSVVIVNKRDFRCSILFTSKGITRSLNIVFKKKTKISLKHYLLSVCKFQRPSSRVKLFAYIQQKLIYINVCLHKCLIKDSLKEKGPSSKVQALPKSINADIWVVDTYFVVGLFCTPHSVCLEIGFGQGSFEWKCCVFNLST